MMDNKQPSWRDIKPVLAEFTFTQLRGLLKDLYNFTPENKTFFHARFLNKTIQDDYLRPYKDRIRKAVCPKEPWKQDQKLAAGRKAVSEFKKANGDLRDTLTLMLYYVECGNDFTLEFGDIDEPFYDSMNSMFSNIIKMLIREKDKALAEEFMPKLMSEFQRVDGQIGWGYPDVLGEWLKALQEAFPESCGVAV